MTIAGRHGVALSVFLLMFFSILPTTAEAASGSSPLMWANEYSGTNIESINLCSHPWAVQQTSDRGYVVAGDAVSFGITAYGECGGASHAWVFKLDSTGNMVWQRTYGGPYTSARSLEQTSDGGYVVAGLAFVGAGGSDAWVFKVDIIGNIVWQRTYGGQYDDGARSIQQTSDGGYVVAGFTSSNVSRGLAYVKGQAWVFKLDSTGNMVWQKTYGNFASSVHQTSDGGYIVVGSTVVEGFSDRPLVFKLDSFGAVVWAKTYDGGGSSIQQTSDGGYVVTGTVSTVSASGYGNSALVLKLDSSGNIVWQKTFGGSCTENGFAASVRQTLDGGYIVAGDVRPICYRLNPSYVAVIKFDSRGNVMWKRSYIVVGEPTEVQQTLDAGYVVTGWRGLGTFAFDSSAFVLKLNAVGMCCQSIEGTFTIDFVNAFVSAAATDITAVDTNATVLVPTMGVSDTSSMIINLCGTG